MGLPFRFSKPANLYFLFLMCLQTIPEVTVTGQIPTIAFPLVWLSFLSCFCLWPMLLRTVIVMNALKDALEDWRRHKSDRSLPAKRVELLRRGEENEREVLALDHGKLKSRRWCDLRVPCLGELAWAERKAGSEVGSMVVVRQNEYVPADLVR